MPTHKAKLVSVLIYYSFISDVQIPPLSLKPDMSLHNKALSDQKSRILILLRNQDLHNI